jgi:hypothetical protein
MTDYFITTEKINYSPRNLRILIHPRCYQQIHTEICILVCFIAKCLEAKVLLNGLTIKLHDMSLVFTKYQDYDPIE